MSSSLRIGQGFDIHKLVEGLPLILGGVSIPAKKGPDAHSDGDVLLHAIIDSLLGAAGKSDIGVRFPNTDPKFKGASSIALLADVWTELQSEGWRILNIDSTLVAEAPKISPYVNDMKQSISETLSIDISQIGIKATTPEKLGSLGREEGIAAFASALLER